MPAWAGFSRFAGTRRDRPRVAGKSVGGKHPEGNRLFRAPGRGFFERPYGWAWLLKLAEELLRYDAALARNLAPLVAVMRAGLLAYLPALTHPVRHGVHNNTAFAVKLALDYARAADDQELKLFCTSRMAYWFGHDTDYGARWEPSGEDSFRRR
ncbi:MAG: DUF2891 family protein [Lacunisphaera sp.]